MTHYLNLTKKQAETALQEFLDERDPALQRFRASLAADGQDPDALLDGTVESLVPLWGWVKSILKERGSEGAASEVATSPSWLRYSIGTEPTLSPEYVAIVDGVISYLCRVVERGAPKAQWRLGFDRHKGYAWQNHPVLALDGEEVPLAELVVPAARGHVSGQAPSADDELARTAASVIERLNRADSGTDQETIGEDEPLVEVEDLGDDPVRGRELSLSLHEEIAHEYSRTVDRLAKELRKQDGITGVLREDREVLLVATPTWTTTELEHWATQYLREKLSD